MSDNQLPGPWSINPNPMIAYHGHGPDGKKCKTCGKLTFNPMRSGRRYYKCPPRGITHGAATDHRVGWDACGKYEEDDR